MAHSTASTASRDRMGSSTSHSHTTPTLQPIARRDVIDLLSRATLDANFADQKGIELFGVEA